eukprot:CAMPEP_0174320840 /NCGR_PEP_ID=MMETSP0810-20121108/9843_1 /TAXON_ID=73025 ORGANISM="Eutreptiella gymnastica-like, Strain CCMP1594" /NCGR_SAMPLE_ID=MMETSP0810 /ASSEMBLY_ACC=CAM_ASM_000659 /LENGTH=85 /DNA_ID=CAMNT_0015431937 /DNA_START=41 /DNA_END=298 /DNA_ORIENTATION=+
MMHFIGNLDLERLIGSEACILSVLSAHSMSPVHRGGPMNAPSPLLCPRVVPQWGRAVLPLVAKHKEEGVLVCSAHVEGHGGSSIS